jgi:cytosine/adenosine deaminase-related metal-dependent hydrolase
MALDEQIGSIEVGKQADLITLRIDLPEMQPLYRSNFAGCLRGLRDTMSVMSGLLASASWPTVPWSRWTSSM